MDTPVVKKRKGISPIWILPLVALILGGWLIYRDYQESGFMITVQITDANGLTVEKTKVMFKGLPIGTLKDFKVSPDLQHIIAEIEMVKQAREKLTTDTKVWVVRPEVSVNRITGLDTLVSGSYFEIQPGSATEPADSFVALNEAPPISERVPGLHLTLSSKSEASLSPGSPVHFKKIEVGEIVSNILQGDGSIETKILIYPKYSEHVTTKSLFYISSGVQVEANLPDISLHLDPLNTILRGGIAFITPDGGVDIEDTRKTIPLYNDYATALDEAPPLSERVPGLHLTLSSKFEASLSPGSPVLFKKIEVGEIVSNNLLDDGSIETKILIYPRYQGHVSTKSLFYVSGGVRLDASLPDISLHLDPLTAILRGGIAFITPEGGESITDTHKPIPLYKDYATALGEAPPLSVRVPGLHLTLTSSFDVSLSPGSPVHYKKVKVGEVVSNTLQDDGSIETKILIYPRYQQHATTRSLFFVSSGIRLDANLPKISLQLDPLTTILRGGITFVTAKGGNPLKDPQKPIPLYEDHQAAEDAGDIQIRLSFSVDHGLESGAEIRYKGVKVGSIRGLTLDKDMRTVHARASIHNSLAHLLKANTYIWAVKARFSASGISDLGALVSGPYLSLLPGTGKESRKFEVYDSRPVNMTMHTGLNLVMETDRLGSLDYDKPIHYRQIQVGHTTGYELSPTGQHVLIYINIYPPYVNLIRENTKFWNNGGLRIKGGLLSGIQISTETLASVISGGISFSTPERDDMGNRVANGRHFVLHSEPQDDWLNWSPALELGPVPDQLLKGASEN